MACKRASRGAVTISHDQPALPLRDADLDLGPCIEIEPAAGMRRRPNRPAQLYRLKTGSEPVYFAGTFNPPE